MKKYKISPVVLFFSLATVAFSIGLLIGAATGKSSLEGNASDYEIKEPQKDSISQANQGNKNLEVQLYLPVYSSSNVNISNILIAGYSYQFHRTNGDWINIWPYYQHQVDYNFQVYYGTKGSLSEVYLDEGYIILPDDAVKDPDRASYFKNYDYFNITGWTIGTGKDSSGKLIMDSENKPLLYCAKSKIQKINLASSNIIRLEDFNNTDEPPFQNGWVPCTDQPDKSLIRIFNDKFKVKNLSIDRDTAIFSYRPKTRLPQNSGPGDTWDIVRPVAAGFDYWLEGKEDQTKSYFKYLENQGDDYELESDNLLNTNATLIIGNAKYPIHLDLGIDNLTPPLKVTFREWMVAIGKKGNERKYLCTQKPNTDYFNSNLKDYFGKNQAKLFFDFIYKTKDDPFNQISPWEFCENNSFFQKIIKDNIPKGAQNLNDPDALNNL